MTLTRRGVIGRSSGGAGHALGSRLVKVRVCFALEMHIDNSLSNDLRSQIRILAREEREGNEEVGRVGERERGRATMVVC